MVNILPQDMCKLCQHVMRDRALGGPSWCAAAAASEFAAMKASDAEPDQEVGTWCTSHMSLAVLLEQ